MSDHVYYVYILASRSKTLYIGFTSTIETRVFQHREGTYNGFTKQYHCHRLVYLERFGGVHAAIAREQQLKRWSRAKKLTLIERENPAWYDLSEEWGKPISPWLKPAGLSATPSQVREDSGRDDNP